MDKDKAAKIKQKVNLAKNEGEINFVKEQGKALGLAVDTNHPY